MYVDRGRQREEGTRGKEIQLDGGRQEQIARGNPLGQPEWEGSADERWWREGGSAIQVDGHSATSQERGGKKRVQIEREEASTGKIWGTIGDRYGGREKRNG